MSIVEKYEVDKLRTAFYKIFKHNDPFRDMFLDGISERIIICPTEGYNLTNEQFIALIESIKAVKDESFYISEIEGENCFNYKKEEGYYNCKHWECELDIRLNEYLKLPIAIENAIYSPSGIWGVMISHEEHAVLGGNDLFIDRFKALYPKWKEELEVFKRKWEYNRVNYNSNIDWCEDLISHIYGPITKESF